MGVLLLLWLAMTVDGAGKVGFEQGEDEETQ